MALHMCRACMRPLDNPDEIVHIFEHLYKDMYYLPIIIMDIFKVKVYNCSTIMTLTANN